MERPVIGMDHFLDSIGMMEMSEADQIDVVNELAEDFCAEQESKGHKPLEGIVYSKEFGYVPTKK